MKLLIITQKVDLEDDVLGFFHRWLEKFASKFEQIYVICLRSGKYSLPSNVKVFSLGKENVPSKIKYVLNFYKYIWKLRRDYDSVFVHMNPIYVVLGGVFWKIKKKKIYLWYNHHFGSFIARAAIKFSDMVFYTSPFSFVSRLKLKKAMIMPAGIDTNIFKKNEQIKKNPSSILYLGRIASIKNLDILIKAANLLDKENTNFLLNIVGEPGEKDGEYFKSIKDLAQDLEKKGKIKFLGKVPNYRTPQIYNENEIFIDLTPSGSLDKSILEAMACETLTLVSSKAFQKILPNYLIFEEKNPKDLKDKIINIFNIKDEGKENLTKKLREYVLQSQNLDNLTEKLLTFLSL